jgi:putative component of membrane protein insertase Oxa1/YidC/SpoIIIJ protein YidD
LNFAIDIPLRKIAVISITGYQKYLSPHKGFACAHRLLYGGDSCSAHIKKAIAQKGLLKGLFDARTRFAACREANLILKSRSQISRLETLETEEPTNRRSCQDSANKILNSCNLSDCCSAVDCCSSVENCNNLDCNLANDCGGLDCAGLDCGGCG